MDIGKDINNENESRQHNTNFSMLQSLTRELPTTWRTFLWLCLFLNLLKKLVRLLLRKVFARKRWAYKVSSIVIGRGN